MSTEYIGSGRPVEASARQRELGLVATAAAVLDETPPPADNDGPRPKQSVAAIALDSLRDLNPRHVTEGRYSTLPLVIFGAAGLLAVAQVEALFKQFSADTQSVMGGFDVAALAPFLVLIYVLPRFAAPGLGYIADRFRTRVWFLRVGLVLGGLAFALVGFAADAPAYIGMLVLATLAGTLTGPASTIIADSYPIAMRVRATFFLQKTSQLGLVLGQPLAALLAAPFGWQWAVIALGGTGILLGAAAFFLSEPAQGAMDRVEAGADPASEPEAQSRLSLTETWRTLFAIASARRLYATVTFFAVAAQVAYRIPIYLAIAFHVGAAGRSVIGSLAGLSGLAGLAVASSLTSRAADFKLTTMPLFAAGSALVALAGLVLVALSPVFIVSIIGILVFSAGIAPILAVILSMFQVVIPARVRTTGFELVLLFFLPGALYNLTVVPFVSGLVNSLGMTWIGVMFLPFAPALVAAAYFLTRAAVGVEADARAAVAASRAEEESLRSRRDNRNKMLICRDVDVRYDGTQVLFGVDLDLEEGEIVALLGTNGAGKSTLLRAIAGIQPASNGAIFMDGSDITHSAPHANAARGVVMLPGGHAVFPQLTVLENLRAAAWMFRADDQYIAAKMEEVLGYFPVLRERQQQKAGNMSGGEQQMLALSQAFLMKPRLLMIDELSLGLAPQVVVKLLEIVRQINAQGTTVLLVEQSINIALALAERAVFMEKGEVRYDGSTAELMQHGEIVRSVYFSESRRGATLSSRPAPRGPSGDGNEPTLRVKDVSVAFGGVHALHSVDLEVAPGEVVGVIGSNGAGKTTLFDTISGFARADSGEVVFMGSDVTALTPDARARLGLSRSFQNVRLFPALTVRENITVALERQLESRSLVAAILWLPTHVGAERRATRRVDGLIESFGLLPFADKFLKELSTGTRRIVDIACVLASGPRLLLLDEPSSGLAQAETEELGPFITRMAREIGCGVLVIEHDIALIAAVSDRLVVMHLGQVVAIGTPSEVLDDPEVSRVLTGGADVALNRSGKLSPNLRPASVGAVAG